MFNYIKFSLLLLCHFTIGFSSGVDNKDSVTAPIPPPQLFDSSKVQTEFQNSTDSSLIYSLDKMVVTAQKKEKQIVTAQTLSVVKSSEWIGTNKGIADIIAEQTGIQTRSYGGTGSYQTVSIRGVQGSDVLILLDGVPLNSAMGGAVDLGKIDPAIIDEIEIYKGVTPAEYGGNSLGGVINLKRKKTTKGKSVGLNSSFGAYGFQNHLFSFGQNLEKMNLYGSLSFERSDNDFKYLDRNSTIDGSVTDPTVDDTIRRFENNQYMSTQVMLYPAFYLNENYTLLSGLSFSYTNNHIPAPEGRVNKTAQYTKKNVNTYISLNNEQIDKKLTVIPQLNFIYKNGKSFGTTLDEAGFAWLSNKRNSYLELGYIEQIINVPVHIVLKPVAFLQINSLVNVIYDDFNPSSQNDYAASGDWHSKEVNASGALDVKLNWRSAGLMAGGSVKGIYAKTDGGFDYYNGKNVKPSDTVVTIGSFTGGFNIHPTTKLLLYCNGGRYSNAPTLRERYGAKGGLAPNPELKPETGYTGDFGCKMQGEKIYADIAGFYNRSKNTIILHHDISGSKPINSEGAIVLGSEINVNWNVNKMLNLQLKSTVQKTKNISSTWYGKKLPNEPDVSILSRIIAGPFRGVTCNYWVDFKSVYYRDPANTLSFRVPAVESSTIGQLFHNIVIEWSPKKDLSFSVSARNLTPDILLFDEAPHSLEGEYSWVIYPTNTWTVAVSYSF